MKKYILAIAAISAIAASGLCADINTMTSKDIASLAAGYKLPVVSQPVADNRAGANYGLGRTFTGQDSTGKPCSISINSVSMDQGYEFVYATVSFMPSREFITSHPEGQTTDYKSLNSNIYSAPVLTIKLKSRKGVPDFYFLTDRNGNSKVCYYLK